MRNNSIKKTLKSLSLTSCLVALLGTAALPAQPARAAEVQDPIGLGEAYLQGKDGKAQNYAEARRLFYKAAQAGNAAAMQRLGGIYDEGRGVAISKAEALAWYLKAAALGDVDGFKGVAGKLGEGVAPEARYQDLLSWLQAGKYPADQKQLLLDILLAQLARRGSAKGVQALLKAGGQIVKDQSYAGRALDQAVRAGRPEIVKLLYQHQALSDPMYAKALDASLRQPAVFSYLYALRPQTPARHEELLTAAIDANALASVKFLLQRGLPAQADGQALLCMATWQTTPDIAAVLVAKGLKVDLRDSEQRTALFCAATEGNPAQLEFLLTHGAAIDAQDADGDTALTEAISAGKIENAKYLLAKGAKASLLNKQGETALFAAARASDSDILLDVLIDLEGHFSLTHQNSNGDTPLHAALKAGRFQSAATLVSWNVHPLIANRAGQTAVDLIHQQMAAQLPLAELDQRWKPLAGLTNEHVLEEKAGRLAQVQRERSQIKANMHTLQTIIETYAVDWDGYYAPNLTALHTEANKAELKYWKDLSNPISGKSAIADTMLDWSKVKPGLEQAGKVYYVPASGKEIAKYWIYGVDHRGGLLQDRGQLFYLSNS